MTEEYKNETWLRKEYVDNGRSTIDIGEQFDVSGANISYYLNKFGIETRSISEANKGKTVSDKTKGKISESVSTHLQENGHPFEGKTHTDESKRKMSEAKMGERNPNFGKKRPEHSERMSGENNPSYIDGRSENIDFRKNHKWKNFSFELKEQADWTCENCGSHGSETEIQTHHAVPIEQGGDEWDNVFIILCKECHGNRNSWWHDSTVSEQLARIGGEPINMMVQ